MAFDAFDPYEEQDEFTSSFFQQPQAPYAGVKQPGLERPDGGEIVTPPDVAREYGATASPSMGGLDSFTSSVFAPGTGVDLARRSAPADYGRSPMPGSEPAKPTAPSSSAQPSSGFDYGSLVGSVRSASDPRQRAVAQDQLARATYSQLKQAGHEVNWDGDNLVVDGRPYVIGDGASAQPPAAAAAPTSGKTAPTNGQTLDYYQNASGRTQGGAASPQEAYDQLAGSIDPNASREEMEAAIESAFGHLPGYGGAYKESVNLNGRWYDMVTGYGGAGASWGGLTPKGPSSSAMSSGMFGTGGLMSSALSPFGGTSGAGIGNRGVEGARGVELSAGLSPSILALLQQQQAPEPEPMQPSYMGLLR